MYIAEQGLLPGKCPRNEQFLKMLLKILLLSFFLFKMFILVLCQFLRTKNTRAMLVK